MSVRSVAAGCVAISAVAALSGAAQLTAVGAARPATGAAGPAGKIQHVVVIFQENRSFDEVLGAFCRDHPGRCDGYVGPVKLASGATDQNIKSPDIITPDPPHNVDTQLRMINGGRMNGWSNSGPCMKNGVNQCISHYEQSQVPALTALAGKYVVSDRTFSFQNSPSYGGHLAIAAATQDNFPGSIPHPAPGVRAGAGYGCDSHKIVGWTDPSTHKTIDQPSCIPAPPGVLDPKQFPYNGAFEPTKVQSVPTIFDRLDAAHLSWKLYASISDWSICPSFAKCEYTSQHNNVVAPTQVLSDAKAGHLPAYSVVLPTGPGGTGQHAPSSMLVGDNWIGKVVNALQASPQWSSTAIFITYDDCGCFYDHVPPPGHNPDGTQQGLREPMVIVSPYAKLGGTDSHNATFASILRFAEKTFGLPPLGINDAQAYDYSGAFTFGAKPTAPRVWPAQQPIPSSTWRELASLPPSDDEAT